MEADLLSCPFCGSPADEYPDGDEEGFTIMCSGKNPLILSSGAEASCPFGAFGYATREISIEAWNTRSNIGSTSTKSLRKIE